jgi:hypothetical protein
MGFCFFPPDADTDRALICQLEQERGWQPERAFDRLSSDRGRISATVTPKEGGALRRGTSDETLEHLFLLSFLRKHSPSTFELRRPTVAETCAYIWRPFPEI